MRAGADQAEGLRRLLEGKRTPVIAFVGLAPGAGTTTTAMNLGVQLARQGKSVLLLDEYGEAPGSACARWGLRPAGIRRDVALRRVDVHAAAAPVQPSLHVLPTGPGQEPIVPHALWPGGLILVDVRLQAQGQLSALARLADDIVVVMQPTPASITATYAGLKRLQFAHALQAFHFLVNQAADAHQGTIVSRNVMNASRRFLAVSVHSLGCVAHDARMQHAERLHKTVSEAFAGTACALDYARIAAALVPGAGAATAPVRAAPGRRQGRFTVAAAA